MERGHTEYFIFMVLQQFLAEWQKHSALDLHRSLHTTSIFTLEVKLSDNSASTVEQLRGAVCFILVYIVYAVLGPIISSTFHQHIRQSS